MTRPRNTGQKIIFRHVIKVSRFYFFPDHTLDLIANEWKWRFCYWFTQYCYIKLIAEAQESL